MKMLDVTLPESSDKVLLDDENADRGLFLVFNARDNLLGVIVYNIDYDSYGLETITNGCQSFSEFDTNNLMELGLKRDQIIHIRPLAEKLLNVSADYL